jgi:hypothetical protein
LPYLLKEKIGGCKIKKCKGNFSARRSLSSIKLRFGVGRYRANGGLSGRFAGKKFPFLRPLFARLLQFDGRLF